MARVYGSGEFTAAFKKLYDDAGRPDSGRIITRAAGFTPKVKVTPSLLTGWRNGNIPRDENVVVFLVGYLTGLIGTPASKQDLERWKKLRAGSELTKRRERKTRRASSVTSRRPPSPFGRVKDVAPQHLAIHPPVRPAPPNAGTRYRLADPPPLGWSEPEYVPRDHDKLLNQQLSIAAEQGSGLIIIVGRSCSGKTRSAWEAIRARLGDWQFADCREPGVLEELAGDAHHGGRLVIWLDDLKRTSQSLDIAAILRRQFAKATPAKPIIAIATSWHGLSTMENGLAALNNLALKPDVEVDDLWTPAEHRRARSAAEHDRFLEMALHYEDFGITQTLAGAPWLFERWLHPVVRETTAVLTAAIDLYRLGIDLVAEELLNHCATGYLPSTRPVRTNWFAEALDEATSPVRDAVVALIPTDRNYRLCDVLQDYGQQARHWDPVPGQVWQALLTADLGSEKLRSLARKAEGRMLFRLRDAFAAAARSAPSPPQGPAAADAPPPRPARAVMSPPRPENSRQPLPPSLVAPDRAEADRLRASGDLEALRRLAIPSNDTYVRRRLAFLLAERGDYQGLLDLAVYSTRGARELVTWLGREGRVADLLNQAVCGNGFARRALETGWTINGLTDEERHLIVRDGLAPDGTPLSVP